MADVAARKMKHINIAVRIRPLNNDEIQAGERLGLHQNGSELQVSSYPQVWNFGQVFGSNAPTSVVFRDVVARMLNDAVDGKNVTIFAYGQTGSGKTYTMEGLMKESAEYLFQQIMGAQDREFLLKMSAVEVYNEAIHDLMQSNQQDTSHSRVELGDTKGGKTIMKGATEESLLSSSHLQRMLARVQINRKVHAYTRADHSRRDHFAATMFDRHTLRLRLHSTSARVCLCRSGRHASMFRAPARIRLLLLCWKVGKYHHHLSHHLIQLS